jgi:prolyl-tRNA editing enzyme YbaK/EbsC (Cys-tRNA(Pro) deacylase)
MALSWRPATESPDLLAPPVLGALADLPAEAARVAAIDPGLADTAAFSEAYGIPLEQSANCVIVAGRRGERTSYAACVVLATTRADVNGLVRRRLDARKASFAPQDEAVRLSGMEFGGITPLGLPADWPVLVDAAVASSDEVVIGSGVRGSKLLVPGSLLAALPAAEVIEGLGQQAA